jgi:hypothetical protein
MPKSPSTRAGKQAPSEVQPSQAPASEVQIALARRASLIASLVLYAIFQVLWIAVTPIKMQSVADCLPNGDSRPILVGIGPDEPQHYLYILSIAETGRIPRPLSSLRRSPDEFISHESQHPPLFYLIAAGLRNLVQPMGDRAVWFALRGLGAVLGALAICLISWAAWIAFPDRPFVGLATPPFLAMLPMFDYMTSQLSNFPLEIAFTSAGWLLLVMLARGKRRLDVKSGGLLALLFGLAAATRQTSAMWIPAVALVFVFVIKNGSPVARRDALAGAALFAAIYLVFALPWFLYTKETYGAFMFRSDYRPMLGNISLGQWLADPSQAINVPNMPNRPHCTVLETAMRYTSTSWVPFWLVQFLIPTFFGSLDSFQSVFLIGTVAALLLLFRHWSDVRHSANTTADPPGRLLIWASFVSVAVAVALVLQQQMLVDIEMFLYAGRYILSMVAAGSFLLLFALSTLRINSFRTAIVGAAIVAAAMLLLDGWTYNVIHVFYTVGAPGL